jgi:hypothetical protein
MDKDNRSPKWGGARHGSGRKPTKFTARLGEPFIVEQKTDHQARRRQRGRVLSISHDAITLQVGRLVIVIRKPHTD